jgi:hypothetical protein
MRTSLMKQDRFAAAIFASLLVIAGSAGWISNANGATLPSVHQAAWNIVSRISGIRTHVPTHAPANNFPDGPLMGNGSVGVAIQGRNTDDMSLYVGREDFWSVLRGRIMPVGRLRLSIPALHNGSYRTRENIGPADVTGVFAARNGHALTFQSWVAKPENLVVVQLHNTGRLPLAITGKLLDGWGTPGAVGMAGKSGNVQWLRVSPDTVNARIGEPSGRDPAGKFHGAISNVRVWPVVVPAGDFGNQPSAAPPRPPAPRFAFLPHARATVIPAQSSTRVDCGNLAMPERTFTVSASINPNSRTGQQAIFSAMTSDKWQHWPVAGPPQISYGFSLSTVNGKLSAMLNRVRVTATAPLPLHRWSHVAAIYNGQSLILVVNGVVVGATRQFPTAAQVVGPQWDWNAIHPGDRQVPYDGCSPKGLLAVRALGADARIAHGALNLTLAPGASATVLLSVMDDRDSPHYRTNSIDLLQKMNSSRLRGVWHAHLVWWKKFWGRSYVHIANRKVEDSWYGSLYLLACSSAPNNIAPGLWGNFITSPHMGWNGDYTLDYNYEAPYWAAYPTNHVALADNYDQALLDWMKRGAALARHRHYHGLFYYAHLSPLPGWSADGAKSIRQKSDALFACVDCLQRWRYTRKPAYARKVYPFLRGVATFWDHDLVEKNGVFMDYNDAADELRYPHDVNPATSIAFLQMLYSGLLDINHSLHLNDPSAATWRHILRHLSPLPIVAASSIQPIVRAVGRPATVGKFVIRDALRGSEWIRLGQLLSAHPPIRITGSSAGMNSHQCIFPAWAIGLESPRRELNAGLSTVTFQKTWYDYNNTSSFYPACADVGYNPTSILHHLNVLITHFSYPNFVFQMGGGGTENFATVPTTLSAMFLQSYQNDIHVFPDWPRNQNASFGHLLACGDFLVSSRMHDDKITYVQIISRRGGVCHVVNPWPGRRVAVAAIGHPETVLTGAMIKFPTRSGEKVLLTAGR